MEGWPNGAVDIQEREMARRHSAGTDEAKAERAAAREDFKSERAAAKAERQAPSDVIAADTLEAVAAHQAVQEDNDQAELSGEVDESAGSLDKFAVADGPTRNEVEAANRARLARGEEPVAEASDDPVLPVPPELEELDGVGEDTMAARQSFVDRVVDGEIVRAEDNSAITDVVEGEPDTLSTTRDSADRK
jgi:hypothetical protein